MLGDLISAVGSIWNLMLLFGAGIALAGFVYFLFLKRVLRARRIAHLRERRLLSEAAQRK